MAWILLLIKPDERERSWTGVNTRERLWTPDVYFNLSFRPQGEIFFERYVYCRPACWRRFLPAVEMATKLVVFGKLKACCIWGLSYAALNLDQWRAWINMILRCLIVNVARAHHRNRYIILLKFRASVQIKIYSDSRTHYIYRYVFCFAAAAR